MKIRPVILCGGSGTRLWPNSKKHQAKQFIDFGGWTLLGKTLERVKGSLFDIPIIIYLWIRLCNFALLQLWRYGAQRGVI